MSKRSLIQKLVSKPKRSAKRDSIYTPISTPLPSLDGFISTISPDGMPLQKTGAPIERLLTFLAMRGQYLPPPFVSRRSFKPINFFLIGASSSFVASILIYVPVSSVSSPLIPEYPTRGRTIQNLAFLLRKNSTSLSICAVTMTPLPSSFSRICFTTPIGISL